MHSGFSLVIWDFTFRKSLFLTIKPEDGGYSVLTPVILHYIFKFDNFKQFYPLQSYSCQYGEGFNTTFRHFMLGIKCLNDKLSR